MSLTARLALNNCIAAHCGPSVNILLDAKLKHSFNFKIPKFQTAFPMC